jgi:signal transduction histidine kinase
MQPVALKATIEKVFIDFRERAAAKQVSLIDKTPDLYLQADADRLEQVLCNLIDNALKYGGTQGTVIVSARPVEQGQIEVSIQDDGPGIPPESIERVFERFYRVDKARSREQGGTGLGLSIVKHIVQGHGGRAWAKSEVGHGATFCMTLPQAPKVFEEITEASAPKPLPIA